MLEGFRGIKELRNVRYLIVEICKEVCLEKCEVFDRVDSCKENVRRNARYLIELRAVRSLLEGFRGIRRVESCKEFVSRIGIDRVGSCKENVRRNEGI